MPTNEIIEELAEVLAGLDREEVLEVLERAGYVEEAELLALELEAPRA